MDDRTCLRPFLPVIGRFVDAAFRAAGARLSSNPPRDDPLDAYFSDATLPDRFRPTVEVVRGARSTDEERAVAAKNGTDQGDQAQSQQDPMQLLAEPEGRFGPGLGAGEWPSI
jgi:hypothetical protein